MVTMNSNSQNMCTYVMLIFLMKSHVIEISLCCFCGDNKHFFIEWFECPDFTVMTMHLLQVKTCDNRKPKHNV